nr:caspase family protein [Pyrinomonadaceae bacterium]
MPQINPKLYALLIGIDKYSQTSLPDGSYYPNLGGCVRDVDLVEQMLKNRLNLPDEQIIKLLSENSNPTVTAERLPTYENLVKAFKEITDLAESGDQIYIHYSGHGGRSLTIFPEIKGQNGLDESLVPCDIGENGVCYFRDLEISFLLKKMSDKGLLVTLVFDSCHSGGATRGEGGAFARGIDSIDTRKQTQESLVFKNIDELKSVLEEFPPSATRNLNSAQGWRLPIPPNLVFIAGCRANEVANEFAFDGLQRNGALTYWMLDSLRQADENFTYKMLCNRVFAKVHTKFINQTPVIEGERDRIVFGGLKLSSGEAVNVTKVDLPNNRITLNTGLFQGVSKGAQFAVFAAETVDFTDISKRLAIVEVENVGTTESTALLVSGDAKDKIAEGSQAVLLGVGIRLRGRIRLVFQNNEFDEGLKKLGDFIAQNEGDLVARDKWVRLCNDGEECDFQVAANKFGEFEIWDAEGKTLPNLRPALSVEKEESLAKMQERLVQLTKYRNVRLIDNTDPASPLANKLKAELMIVKTDKNGKETLHSLAIPPRPLSVGEKACLRVTNLSNMALNFVILDLAPDWGISQIHPDPNSQDFDFLDKGATFDFKMEAFLPSDDYQSGTDILKVFATVEGTSFRWLQMSPLDQPP